MPYQLLIAHCLVILDLMLVVVLVANIELVFFFSREIVVLAKLVFVSLILFQFGCFILSVEAFNQFTCTLKVQCILVQQYLLLSQ